MPIRIVKNIKLSSNCVLGRAFQLIIINVVFFASLLSGIASAGIINTYAVAAATQNDAGITVVYGSVGGGLMIRPAPTSQGGDGFFKFDLSAVPDNHIIESATLYLDWNSTNEPIMKFGIFHGSNDSWDMDNLNSPIGYDANQQMGYATIDEFTPTFQYTSYALDLGLNNLIADLFDDELTLAIIVDDVNSNPSNYTYLHTFEENGGYRNAYLSLSTVLAVAVPTPAPLMLILTGIICLNFNRRKKFKLKR